MHDYLIEMLECPVCHDELGWKIEKQNGERIEQAEARCKGCGAIFPIHEGIGVFLTPDLPRNDLWEQTSSKLTEYLRNYPEVERQLMDVPLETLGPVDQYYRGKVLKERGDYKQAKVAFESTRKGIYTSEYRAGIDNQMSYVIQRLSSSDGPIVDLASGECKLVKELTSKLKRPIVATDFSPRVLRRVSRDVLRDMSREVLRDVLRGGDDRLSLLAFDARRTPFKDGAIKTLTTLAGLANIEEPDTLLQELRRIVSGTFLAISEFYPEDDEANRTAMQEMGVFSPLQFRHSALERFAAAGWKVEVAKAHKVKVRSAPTGVVLKGAKLDALPAADTVLENCVLVAV